MRLLALFLVPAVIAVSPGPDAVPDHILWGFPGHEMIGQLAAESLPEGMPAFFRDAADQLSWMNPEPDRWRDQAERARDPAMAAAYQLNHYINFERLPESALQAPDRFAFVDSLRAAGHAGPLPGMSPYAILEKTQRLRSAFRRWRAADSEQERRWIEQRIINDAGILGHYVADGSNPHHTTIHFNGWDRDTPNPRGFTTDRTFHRRFESDFVRANVEIDDLRPHLPCQVRVFGDLRPEILSYLRESNGLVERLYELEKQEPFGAETRSREHLRFTAERLAEGARMLRDLWWTAWVTSADE